MEQEPKDCAFQYAYRRMDIHIQEDTDLITLSEAKELYKKYEHDFIRKLREGRRPEMVIWTDMKDNTNYHKSLVHLNDSYKTDGINLWKEKVEKEFVSID